MRSEPTLELTPEEIKMLPAFPPQNFTKEKAVELVRLIKGVQNDK